MNRIKEILEERGIKQTWLADKLNKSYNMVNSYVQNRRQPSLDDLYKIAEVLGVEAKELLVTKLKIPESDEKLITNTRTVRIPLLGTVACGSPIFAEENIEAMIPVSEQFIKSSNKYFILRASGDSMNEVGINSGDLVLIKQQNTAENGDYVIALIDDEATIKEYHNNGELIILKPRSSNPKHTPIFLTFDFRIQGIVEKVIQINNY
jgi:repressor LexA